jgi:hypothetical protein
MMFNLFMVKVNKISVNFARLKNDCDKIIYFLDILFQINRSITLRAVHCVF